MFNFDSMSPDAKQAVRVDRLHVLHELALELSVSKEMRARFDLSDWAKLHGETLRSGDGVVEQTEDGCAVIREGACGTAACMIGWAASLRVFRDEGFCLKTGRSIFDPVAPYYHEGKRYGWGAVEAFFGIPGTLTEYLFASQAYPGHKVTPLMVAERIHEVIEEVTR